ncbi:nucleotide exchange factor GrpE [Stigmatella sp. ncwal1]|uniref:Nucleotide exchange factor GrpE n=1 Tax=Stigmatella ashevillensis TaxID=2995309 RepID=A0ABT5DHL9_9BACT|nr:nucleotide exchange factor GrpE [Stigmatella ashevillena]MDC0713145.1 nucleotide exchange factor GrpE [Stigmatella ashevillena]
MGTLLDAVQKSSRAHARLTLQVEDLERKLEGGLSEMRGTLQSLKATGPGRPPASEPHWDVVLDALDLLDEAVRVASPELAPGLAGVAARLENFLVSSGLTRLVPAGHPADGRVFRVVGTEPHVGLPEGAVVRVVRAAVLRGDRLVREGEAITVRNPT